jgi:hypothetical protein
MPWKRHRSFKHLTRIKDPVRILFCVFLNKYHALTKKAGFLRFDESR